MNIMRSIQFVVRHPLSQRRRLDRFGRFLGWQIGSRLVPGPVVVPFVNETRLLINPGMHGATGNVYVGLHEFDEMAFVLHALRSNDVFVDVGANVGTYTVLSAGAVGCWAISIEPDTAAIARLRENIHLNRVEQRVETHQVVLGDCVGEAFITTSHDTMNRVVLKAEALRNERTTAVPMSTLDSILSGRSVTLVKIDVEGFEANVIAGASEALANPNLLAVIVETNPNVIHNCGDTMDVDRQLRHYGYRACRYDGSTRQLTAALHRHSGFLNTLYVKDLTTVQERCSAAPRFRVLDSFV